MAFLFLLPSRLFALKLSQWINSGQSAPLLFHSSFYFQLALCLLVLPLRWLFAWVLAAMIHEVGHIIAIVWSGHRVGNIVIKGLGAEIHTDSLGSDEWLCAMAGPVASSFLVLLSKVFPLLAICAFIQATVNLLPIPPLDGGRILKGLLCFIFEEKNADKYTKIIGILIVIVTLIAFWYFSEVSLRFVVIGICIIIIVNIVKIKIPCKHRNKWVQ